MSAEQADPKMSAATTPAVAQPGDAAGSTPDEQRLAVRPDYRIPGGSRWAGLWKAWAGLGAVGLGLGGVGCLIDPKRFAFSYLFAFVCVLTLALGSLFFIIVERLTSAAWSVSIRRLAELFASGFPALVLLFLPVVLSMDSLYPWLHESPDAAAESATSPPDESSPRLGASHTGRRAVVARAPHPDPHRGPDGSEVARPGQPPARAVRPTPAPPGGRATHADTPSTPAGRPGAARHAEALEAREAETLAKKAGFLNRPFFLARAALYFAAWLFIGLRFLRLSTAQDASEDPALTRQAQGFAPVALVLFGLSLSFAGFDWVMSLEPAWSSTIFGVIFFAGSAVTIYAALTVLAMALCDSGMLRGAVNQEHFHDLGKLLFGFMVFWAYVSFSQFMLIWYAALPEETPFYHLRWDVGPWAYVSLLVVIGNFVVPFFLLLSRNVKRRLPLLRLGAVWLLVMHVVDVYWLVMPNYDHGESKVSWVDFACLAGVVGVYLAVVFRNMTRYPLIPVGDPRLARSLAFENE